MMAKSMGINPIRLLRKWDNLMGFAVKNVVLLIFDPKNPALVFATTLHAHNSPDEFVVRNREGGDSIANFERFFAQGGVQIVYHILAVIGQQVNRLFWREVKERGEEIAGVANGGEVFHDKEDRGRLRGCQAAIRGGSGR